MEGFACVKFLDDNVKYYFVPISSVFNKKNDDDHIVPVNFEDFDRQKKYFILWTDKQKYPGYIICLDESEEEVKKKALVKPKRLRIRKKLTSSDTTSDEENEEVAEKSLKLNLCRRFAQNESSQRIITQHKKQILMKNCKELAIEESDDSTNSSCMKRPVLKNYVTIPLTDCLNTAQCTTKARKTCSQPTLIKSAAIDSANKDVFQDSETLTRPSMSRQRKMSLQRGKPMEEFPDPPQCNTEEINQREEHNTRFEQQQLRTFSLSPSNAPNIEDSQSRLNQQENAHSEDSVNEREVSDGHSDHEDDDDDEYDRTQCKYLYTYKPKLYRTYKKKNFDMFSRLEEPYAKCEVMDDKVYLGLDVKVGEKSWRISNTKKHTSFLRDLGGYLWKKREIVKCCLDVKKVKNSLPEDDSIKLCSPRKLNLYLSLFDDYLTENKKYKHLKPTEKDVLIKNSTETLTALIRDERKILMQKNVRRTV